MRRVPAGGANSVTASGFLLCLRFCIPLHYNGHGALYPAPPAARLQVLVVSVTGTPNRPDGVDFVSDFVEAAQLAVAAGEVLGFRVCGAVVSVHTLKQHTVSVHPHSSQQHPYIQAVDCHAAAVTPPHYPLAHAHCIQIHNPSNPTCTCPPAGAQILEANLSCPNVGSHQGVLYSDPDAVAAVTERLRSAFPGVPLILKASVHIS